MLPVKEGDYVILPKTKEDPKERRAEVLEVYDYKMYALVCVIALDRESDFVDGLMEVPIESLRPWNGKLDKFEVMRDPAEKQEETWRVVVNGRLTSPRFNSRGAAEAYRDGIAFRKRKPEWSSEALPGVRVEQPEQVGEGIRRRRMRTTDPHPGEYSKPRKGGAGNVSRLSEKDRRKREV